MLRLAGSPQRRGQDALATDGKMPALPGLLLGSHLLLACSFSFSQSFQHGCDDQRQADGSVYEQLAKLSALSRRHKLSPRNRLAIRTAR